MQRILRFCRCAVGAVGQRAGCQASARKRIIGALRKGTGHYSIEHYHESLFAFLLVGCTSMCQISWKLVWIGRSRLRRAIKRYDDAQAAGKVDLAPQEELNSIPQRLTPKP